MSVCVSSINASDLLRHITRTLAILSYTLYTTYILRGGLVCYDLLCGDGDGDGDGGVVSFTIMPFQLFQTLCVDVWTGKIIQFDEFNELQAKLTLSSLFLFD